MKNKRMEKFLRETKVKLCTKKVGFFLGEDNSFYCVSVDDPRVEKVAEVEYLIFKKDFIDVRYN